VKRFARPNIAEMQGYSPGEQLQDQNTVKLNTNENPHPPSPAVEAALAAVDTAKLRTYPQPTADHLRDAVAEHHALARDNVVMTHGGDEALRLAITTFIAQDQAFGMAEPSYSLYPVLAQIHDAPVIRVPLDDQWAMPASTAETLNSAGAALTCIVNPHAPSGKLISTQQLSVLARQLDGLLLIDEAYADFVEPKMNYNSSQLIKEHDNVLILRTFSKGYSLAGLRLGYLLGPAALIDPILRKTRDSYNIDYLSQQLGAAALLDQDYAASTWADVRTQRKRLMMRLQELGFTAPDSQANFLLATMPSSTPMSARELYLYLKEHQILVRFFDTPRLQNKLRISIGTAQQNDRLIDALVAVLPN